VFIAGSLMTLTFSISGSCGKSMAAGVPFEVPKLSRGILRIQDSNGNDMLKAQVAR
jgi:hypothetical protein